MFSRLISRIAGNYNEKKIKKIMPLVAQVNNAYETYETLTHDDILTLTQQFKERIANGTSLDDILPEAFGLLKQACKRLMGTEYMVKWQPQTWAMIPYDVQIIGAINLHQWRISEMKTGEGKTLVATMPAYLNALAGKGVHIVTVNDYLASRDAEQMTVLYEYLWLSVGCVVKATPLHLRREEYAKDITYVENSELGFDYLRDNLAKSLQDRNVTRRPLSYAIVDEVDSILIDESRTPLIISEPDAEPTDKYSYYASIVQSLIPSKTKKKVSKGLLHDMLNKSEATDEDYADYYIDEKTKTVALSSAGIEKLEKMLNVENLYKDFGFDEIHHIENALKARACYHDGKEYMIKNNEVLIIDENTGRAMPGRRFSQWLHQAIEAKESVTIQKESKTIATITYQNFFKLYSKLAGMTGTATTEWEEFDNIYNLQVLAIPTHKEVIRVDKNDMVYINQNAKWKHVVEHIAFAHQMGQPLLIGTSSIQTSELVSTLLKQQNIVHSVLNAKYHEQEANIIARAGQFGSVVVATNMAGRGTDIKLTPGLDAQIATNYANWIAKQISWQTIEKEAKVVVATLYSRNETERTIDAIREKFWFTEEQIIRSYHETVGTDTLLQIKLNTKKKLAGEWYARITIKHAQNNNAPTLYQDFHYGLAIIGTEKHESRRIDNQLRGRAGRQGDAGMSVFYVWLDDSIMRKMGWDKIQSVARLLLPANEIENLALTQSQFTNSIIRAQKQMEWRHFGIRKHLFDYDSVIDKQRKTIYAMRDTILFTLDTLAKKSDSPHPLVKGGLGEFDETTAKKSSIVDTITSYILPTVGQFLQTQAELGVHGDELVTLINNEFGLALTLDHLQHGTDKWHSHLATHIAQHIHDKLSQAESVLTPFAINDICARVAINIIDRYWIAHIDEMQYLRDKVGLMGYAQLDPLVIYKKESFDKYQALLHTIKYSTIITLANTDFSQIAQNMIAAFQQQENNAMMQKLQSAAANAPTVSLNTGVSSLTRASNSRWREEGDPQGGGFVNKNNSSDFDIIDMSQTPNHQITNSPTPQNTKIRPNDKVNVRYQDGKIVMDVKYKKVEDDVKSGKCQLI